MKCAVIGSRGFNDYELLKRELSAGDISVIVSGGAKGADKLAEKFAKEFNISTEVYLPDWSLGRHAGFLRNTQIIEAADVVVAFWDGISNGTKDSITKAKKAGKPVKVVLFNQNMVD